MILNTVRASLLSSRCNKGCGKQSNNETPPAAIAQKHYALCVKLQRHKSPELLQQVVFLVALLPTGFDALVLSTSSTCI